MVDLVGESCIDMINNDNIIYIFIYKVKSISNSHS